jgi:hypothetical protein
LVQIAVTLISDCALLDRIAASTLAEASVRI